MTAPTIPLRAALYLRVSTARQAEHDVPFPGQKRQGEACCALRGYQLVETCVERRSEHIAELNKRSAESELRLKRHSDAIEAGVADLDDPALKDRIEGLKAIRDQADADADADRAQAMLQNSGQKAVTPQMLRKFARLPASVSCWKAPAIAATTCARWRSASRSPRARFVSWDRRPGCYRRLWREMAVLSV